MATNNNGNLLDTAGNVFVDFVWGNIPMQPNDERSTNTDYTATSTSTIEPDEDYGWSDIVTYPSSRLNPTLSNHAVVEAKYAGFPAFADGDGAYISGVAYIQVPNVIGLTTVSAIDALRDAGYENANITTASAAANAAKTITDAARTAGSTQLTLTTSAAHGYSAGQLVTISGVDASANGTWVVSSGTSGTTLVVGTTPTTVLALTGITGSAVAVAGTTKTQSTAAGAGSIASTATITITPWATAS